MRLFCLIILNNVLNLSLCISWNSYSGNRVGGWESRPYLKTGLGFIHSRVKPIYRKNQYNLNGDGYENVETGDFGVEDGMVSNEEFDEMKNEKNLKIPYVMDFPIDRVDDEPGMTREDVARSILLELGFFNHNKLEINSLRRVDREGEDDEEWDDEKMMDTELHEGIRFDEDEKIDFEFENFKNIKFGGISKLDMGSIKFDEEVSKVLAEGVEHQGAVNVGEVGDGVPDTTNTGNSAANQDNTPTDNANITPETSSDKIYNSVRVDGEEEELDKNYVMTTTLANRIERGEDDAMPSILDEDDESSCVVGKQRVRWFPNHVARSLGKLHWYLRMADVILDVRDGRMPFIPPDDYLLNLFESEFPTKPRITVFTHSDVLPRRGMADWMAYYRGVNKALARVYNAKIPDRNEHRVVNRTMFVNARDGLKEIIYLRKHMFRMCRRVNERRGRMGLAPRPIRAIVIGMPNVGKSSLINRILGRKATTVHNIPGITRDINIYREEKRPKLKLSRNDPNYYREVAKRTGPPKRKSFVMIDTPGFVAPITNYSCFTNRIYNIETQRRGPGLEGLYAQPSEVSTADVQTGIPNLKSKLTSSVTFEGREYEPSGVEATTQKRTKPKPTNTFEHIYSDEPPNVKPNAKMQRKNLVNKYMLLYSGLNIISECAYEVDEVAMVVLYELIKMVNLNPEYVEIRKLTNKYPLLRSLVSQSMDLFSGPDNQTQANEEKITLDNLEYHIDHYFNRLSKFLFGDNINSCCSRFIKDFRDGKLGKAMFQIPPFQPNYVNHYLRSVTNSTRGDVARLKPTRTPLANPKLERRISYTRGIYENW